MSDMSKKPNRNILSQHHADGCCGAISDRKRSRRRYYIAVVRVEYPTYYPGVATLKDAGMVAFRDGDGLVGFDFKIVRHLDKISVIRRLS